ncbi:MAG: ABC transporter permease [Gemmatimonadota bacterium]|nr:MAG: ABC transporter permease [Gemmatimonadota bacterium]
MKPPVSTRLYRQLLRLYPASFRERYGSEMERAFVASLDAQRAQRGRVGLLYAWIAVLWDTVRQAAEERRSGRLPTLSSTYWGSIAQDIKLAFRRIRKTPGFTIVAAMTVALGITVTTLIFTIVNACILRPLPHIVDPQELAFMHREFPSRGAVRVPISYPDFLEIRERTTTMVDVAAVIPEVDFLVRIGDDLDREIMGAEVSENYFRLLGRQLVLGGGLDPASAASRKDHVVIGHGLWQREFGGDHSVLGETMWIDGRRYTVVGVAPPSSSWGMVSGTIEAGVWIPIKQRRRNDDAQPALMLVGRRADGRTMDRVQAEVAAVGSRLASANPASWQDRSGEPARLVALTDIQARMPHGARTMPSVIMYVILVALTLSITCSNVANLLLNRALRRRGEIAVCLSLGCGRGRLVRQHLIESLLLFGLAGSLSLLFIHWQTQLLAGGRSFYPFAVDVTVDPAVVLFAAAITAISGFVFGLAPALQATRPDIMGALKGTGEAVRLRRFGVRNLFVLAQVAGSTVLVAISALMARDIQRADQRDLGFDAQNAGVLSLDLALRDYDGEGGGTFLRQLSERCEDIPGVEAIAIAGWTPLSGSAWSWGGIVPEGYQVERDESAWANWNPVTPDYFGLIDMPILRGRDFTELDDEDAPRVMVVNQAFANRYWPGENPIGKTVSLHQRAAPVEVVGLVRNAKYRKADFVNERTSPHFWLPWAQQPSLSVELLFKTRADPAPLFGAIREQVRTLDRDLPIKGLERIESVTAMALLEERIAAAGLAGFGLTMLFLAVLGIYAVTGYAVVERTRELGIRLALGARPGRVVKLVVLESVGHSAVGIVVGLCLAAIVARGVRALLLGIGPLDPASFLGSTLVLVLAAATAALLPAWRASRVDPAVSLRSE